MKKKCLVFILSILATICVCVGFTACELGFYEYNNGGNNSSDNSQNQGNNSGNNNQNQGSNYSNFIFSGSSVRAVNTSISGAIVIPSEHNGTTITTIPANAFKDCTNITSIEVPESVTSIGAGAFSGCSALIDVTLPFVGSNRGNYGLPAALFGYIFGSTSYEGGSMVEQYSPLKNTFYIPATLQSVTITNETAIGQGAFQNCSMLTEINLNNEITKVGISSFENCDNIAEINLPGITSIPSYLFKGCTSLSNFTISDSVNTIDSSIFAGCTGITSVEVPESVTSIGAGAFSGCSALIDITLPFIGSQKGNYNSATALFGYVFGTTSYEGGTKVEQHSPLKNTFYIPSTLRIVKITNEIVIGDGAFQNCSMLTSLTINTRAQDFVGVNAFENTVIPVWAD